MQSEDAAALGGDVSVAQVPPEQLAIGGLVQSAAFTSRACCEEVLLTPGAATPQIVPPPSADRLDRDAMAPRVDAVGHALLRGRQRGGDGLVGSDESHAGTVASTTDKF